MRKHLICIFFLCSLYPGDLFVAGEGNFFEPGSGTISRINEYDGSAIIFDGIGSVVHSLKVYQNMLIVAVNGDYLIKLYYINDDSLEEIGTITLDGQSPREMIVLDHKLFVTTWDPDWYVYPYVNGTVKVVDLNTLELIESIDVGIMPEDIIYKDGYLWVANSGEDTISKLDFNNNIVVENIFVGQGPTFLADVDNDIFVSRTYYDENWNASFGTSKINLGFDNQVDIASYGAGVACTGSIMTNSQNVYRGYDGGIAPIDNNLEIITSQKIGNYNASMVYHSDNIDDYVWMCITDFSDVNLVKMLDLSGNEILTSNVGAIPGDIAKWEKCYFGGDVADDGAVDVSDVVLTVYNIINLNAYECESDLNGDGIINVSDVLLLVGIIIN